MIVPTILVVILLANLIYDLTGFIIKCFDRTKREKDIEKMYNRSYIQTLREMEDYAKYTTRKHDSQIVYKVDGDFNGDIKGDNVTVILMGNGDFNGDISSKDGEVVVIKGNINGDVKANKVLCPTEPKTGSNSSDCFKCAWLDENGTCKSWDVNEGKCEYVGKTQFETLWSCNIPQGTSPQKRTDHYTSIGNCVSIYGSSPLAHIKCPHCKKYFATQLNVRTSVVDGDVVETSVEEMRHDY